MRAADTNVVLRLIVEDDERQTLIVRELLRNETLRVPLTVIMEVEWVLRGAYRWARTRIADAVVMLTDLDGLDVDDAAMVRWAADRLRDGADFADMIHLVSAHHASGFVTFDRRLTRAAGDLAPLPIETLGVS